MSNHLRKLGLPGLLLGGCQLAGSLLVAVLLVMFAPIWIWVGANHNTLTPEQFPLELGVIAVVWAVLYAGSLVVWIRDDESTDLLLGGWVSELYPLGGMFFLITVVLTSASFWALVVFVPLQFLELMNVELPGLIPKALIVLGWFAFISVSFILGFKGHWLGNGSQD